jgi:hypothetical protein
LYIRLERAGKDRDTVFAFYDFPAEHRQHLLTTNPIESRFATVRRRKVILGVKFRDGIEVVRPASSSRCRLTSLVTKIRRSLSNCAPPE